MHHATDYVFRRVASLASFILISLALGACAAGYYPAPTGQGAAVEGVAESAPMPAQESAVEGAAAAGESAHVPPPAYRDHRVSPAPTPHRRSQRRSEPVTAGVVDDNEQWNDYLDYRRRHGQLWVRHQDVSERMIIQVWDQQRRPVHDAVVEIYADQRRSPLTVGRTDTGGRFLFHPRIYGPRGYDGETYRVVARKGHVAQHRSFGHHDGDRWSLELVDPPAAREIRLDLLFLVDATGSMDDEIDKLKRSMADMADQIDRLPERPSVRYGLVAYRDHGDEFVVRSHDFNRYLHQFQADLSRLRADGGGDYPEDLERALYTAVHNMNWTAEDAVRLIVLVADAPPHLHFQMPFNYANEIETARFKGIKIFPVGASGLDEQGEYIFRQMAQFTGGKFVFLTYDEGGDPSSGPGTETHHDVDNYSVDTLDRLIVRLVREELARLSASGYRQ